MRTYMRICVREKGRQSQKSVTIPKSRLQGYNPKVNAKPVDEGQGHHDDRTGRCHPSVSPSVCLCGCVWTCGSGPACVCTRRGTRQRGPMRTLHMRPTLQKGGPHNNSYQLEDLLVCACVRGCCDLPGKRVPIIGVVL